MSEEKFLNSERTAELWDKVKEQVNSIPEYSAGRGVALTDTTEGKDINVELPTVTLTKAAYNALSEEEKQSETMYAVIDDTESPVYIVNAPIGAIMVWSGTEDSVPQGWSICNGENGTPDYRGRFILGASDEHEVGETGGAEEVTLTEAQMPEHAHSVKRQSTSGSNSSNFSLKTSSVNSGTEPYSSLGSSTGNTGIVSISGHSHPHENMPPYYTALWIQKTGVTPSDYATEERVQEIVQGALNNIPNENLLDNWYFPNAINQRKVSGNITTTGYFLDRWKLVDGSVTVTDGLPLMLNGTICQITEENFGEDVVASALTSTGSATVNWDSATNTFTIVGENATIIAVKLEHGLVQTLIKPDGMMNDTIPRYSEQLNRCLRYFVRIYGSGQYTGITVVSGYNPTRMEGVIHFSVPLYTKKTVKFSYGGNVQVYYYDSSSFTPTSITVNSGRITPFTAMLQVNHDSKHTGTGILELMGAAAYLEFSAEL